MAHDTAGENENYLLAKVLRKWGWENLSSHQSVDVEGLPGWEKPKAEDLRSALEQAVDALLINQFLTLKADDLLSGGTVTAEHWNEKVKALAGEFPPSGFRPGAFRDDTEKLELERIPPGRNPLHSTLTLRAS